MYKFLESLDQKRLFKIFLAPVWLLLEYICYRKYWYNIVLIELADNEKIFDFLDKNEFGYKNGKFIKKDLLDGLEFYEGRKLEEVKLLIKKEFVDSLSTVISENANFDIQDFINLIVKTEIKMMKDNGEIYRNKIFEVTIQYCRYWWVVKAVKYSLVWLSVILLLASSLYFIF